MSQNPYERFQYTALILRDELAIDRTILANERTLLAYLRAAVTLVIAGVTFLHFFPQGTLLVVGIICLPFGTAVGIFGYWRWQRMNRGIRLVRKSLKAESQAVSFDI